MKKKHIGKKLLAFTLAATMVCSVNVSMSAQDTVTETDGRIAAADGALTIPNTDSSISDYNASFLSVNGFAADGVTDRSAYVDTDYHRQVDTAEEFVEALYDAQTANGAKVKVIEIMKDLNLGYNYLAMSDDKYNSDSEMNQKEATKDPGALFSRETKISDICTNPLITEAGGVSNIQIKDTVGLTIFSRYGATINHTQFDLQSTAQDIVIRNIAMDGVWQWDNTAHHKESGITFIKVNGAKDVWIDHCSFTMAQDGLVDLENGANGITLSWCKVGVETEEALENESIVASINYMEELYQKDKAVQATNPDAPFTYSNINMGGDWDSYSTPYDASGNKLTLDDIKAGAVVAGYRNSGGDIEPKLKMRYPNMREAGWTVEEIMKYAAYHSKVHLTGSGDKDWATNAQLEISLGYNWYRNIAQRVPMIRQGTGHVYNCYIDDMAHMQLEAKGAASVKNGGYGQGGNYTLSRCLNARNGASIAADTCVFYGINGPITGAECQGDDTANMNDTAPVNFSKTFNHVLIVNSKTTNTSGATYTGSSWDYNGENQFNADFSWHDKSTINHWAWSSKITNNISSGVFAGAFNVQYDYAKELPYSYQLVPLEDVESVVKTNAGAGIYDMTPEQWTKTTYSATEDIQAAGENKINIASKVEIVEEAPVTYVGDTIKLNVVTTPLNVTDPVFTWESTGAQRKRVNVDPETGEIEALKAGNVTIKVTCKSINGTTVSGSTSLKILEADQKPVDPNVTDGAIDVTGGAGTVTDDVSNVTGEVGDTTGDASDVTGDNSEVTGDNSEVTGDNSEVTGDNSEVTGDDTEVSGDDTEVSGDNSEVTGDNSEVTGGTGEVTPPTGEVTPPTGEVTPPSGEITPPSGEITPGADEVTPGDVDLDGDVDLLDAQEALKAALGIGDGLTGSALVAADVDGIKGVDLRDAQIILKLALGIPVELPAKDTQTQVAQLVLKKKLGL